MIDHKKVLFSTLYNSYKNINVYHTTVEVTGVGFMGSHNFDTSITVEAGTRFAFIKVPTNHSYFNGSTFVPDVLRTSMMGYGAYSIEQSLSTDPYGDGTLSLWWSMIISGTTVTFRLTGNNPNDLPVAFNSLSVPVEYATFTTDN